MADDLTVVRVAATVAEAVERVTAELARLGVSLFAVIDHAAGARSVGLELADEVLLVFGNPAVGTALMQADPRAGLDLPLRMLVWDEGGQTCLAYTAPSVLGDRYALTGQESTLAKLAGVLDHLVALAGPGPQA